MQSVGYWEAWSIWLSGQKVDEFQMWNVPLLWWGRIGKLLQFTGGLSVVIDLVGSERLRRLSEAISSWRRYLHLAMTSGSLANAPKFVVRLSWMIGGVTAILGVAILAIAVREFPALRIDLPQPHRAAIGLLSLVITFALTLALTYGISWIIGQALVVLAWLVHSEGPGHPMRWVAFILVIMGFHFDLLAS